MLSVTFLGTSAARPTVERNVSGVALVREGETLLFECGEGTQRQMMRYGVSFALSEICFTHSHADHFLGVIGLVRTMGPQERAEPRGLCGVEKAKAAGIPEGPLWGKLSKGETVGLPDGRTVSPEGIVGPPRPGRLVVFTGDTRPCAAVVDAAQGADLLIHEATFGEEEKDRAKETGHSTAREAAQVALAAKARRLVLSHVSARYSISAEELVKEARDVFQETVVAKDGMTVEVPFND